MLINVTARDIKLGTRRNFTSCPIARAIRRRFPRRPLKVYTWWIEIGLRTVSNTPQLTRFVNAFDNGRRVRPFKFDLPIK